MFDPNNLLTLTIATQLTLTLTLNPNLPNYIMTASKLVGKKNRTRGPTLSTHQHVITSAILKETDGRILISFSIPCIPLDDNAKLIIIIIITRVVSQLARRNRNLPSLLI